MSRTSRATLPIRSEDRGRRTAELDLALAFDPATRTYSRFESSVAAR